jgi:ribosomal protein S18 acetylase RimI-like enzyme
MEIELAKQSDLWLLKELDRECFPAGNLHLEPAPEGEIETGLDREEIRVIKHENRIIGMIQVEKQTKEWELLTLAISEQFRAKRLGSLFLEDLETEFLVSQAEKIRCVTSPNNSQMRKLLERFGFRKTKELPDYFGPNKHRLLYEREK